MPSTARSPQTTDSAGITLASPESSHDFYALPLPLDRPILPALRTKRSPSDPWYSLLLSLACFYPPGLPGGGRYQPLTHRFPVLSAPTHSSRSPQSSVSPPSSLSPQHFFQRSAHKVDYAIAVFHAWSMTVVVVVAVIACIVASFSGLGRSAMHQPLP